MFLKQFDTIFVSKLRVEIENADYILLHYYVVHVTMDYM